jgi:hypothetical protein
MMLSKAHDYSSPHAPHGVWPLPPEGALRLRPAKPVVRPLLEKN